jgi:hypothetical protein
MLKVRHAPLAVVSAVVLVRQGMSAWIQLDGHPEIESHAPGDIAQQTVSLPAAEHSELLAALTSLVLSLCNQRESA